MNKNKLFSILAAIAICSIPFWPVKSAVLTQQSNPTGLVILVAGSTVAGNGSISFSSAASASLTVVPNIFINNGNGNVGIKTSSPTVTFEVNGITQINGRLKVLNTSVFASSIASLGVADGTDIAAGYVGEFVSDSGEGNSNPGASGAYINVSTITLTAGDWEITGACTNTLGGTTAMVEQRAGISTTPSSIDSSSNGALTSWGVAGLVNQRLQTPVGPRRVSITGSTTYNLVCYLAYTTLGGAVWTGADSHLQARRIR